MGLRRNHRIGTALTCLGLLFVQDQTNGAVRAGQRTLGGRPVAGDRTPAALAHPANPITLVFELEGLLVTRIPTKYADSFPWVRTFKQKFGENERTFLINPYVVETLSKWAKSRPGDFKFEIITSFSDDAAKSILSTLTSKMDGKESISIHSGQFLKRKDGAISNDSAELPPEEITPTSPDFITASSLFIHVTDFELSDEQKKNSWYLGPPVYMFPTWENASAELESRKSETDFETKWKPHLPATAAAWKTGYHRFAGIYQRIEEALFRNAGQFKAELLKGMTEPDIQLVRVGAAHLNGSYEERRTVPVIEAGKNGTPGTVTSCREISTRTEAKIRDVTAVECFNELVRIAVWESTDQKRCAFYLFQTSEKLQPVRLKATVLSECKNSQALIWIPELSAWKQFALLPEWIGHTTAQLVDDLGLGTATYRSMILEGSTLNLASACISALKVGFGKTSRIKLKSIVEKLYSLDQWNTAKLHKIEAGMVTHYTPDKFFFEWLEMSNKSRQAAHSQCLQARSYDKIFKYVKNEFNDDFESCMFEGALYVAGDRYSSSGYGTNRMTFYLKRDAKIVDLTELDWVKISEELKKLHPSISSSCSLSAIRPILLEESGADLSLYTTTLKATGNCTRSNGPTWPDPVARDSFNRLPWFYMFNSRAIESTCFEIPASSPTVHLPE